MRNLTPYGKGKGLGKRCRQYPGPLLYPLIYLVSENPVCRKPGFREQPFSEFPDPFVLQALKPAPLDGFVVCGHSEHSSNLVGVVRVKDVALYEAYLCGFGGSGDDGGER